MQAYTAEMHRMAGVVSAINKSSMTDAEKLKATGRGCGLDARGCEARAGGDGAGEERSSLNGGDNGHSSSGFGSEVSSAGFALAGSCSALAWDRQTICTISPILSTNGLASWPNFPSKTPASPIRP